MNKRELIEEIYCQNEPGILFADGFDECIIGVADMHWNEAGNHVVAYNTQAIIANLVEQGMTEEEACEYFSFNIAGAFVGSYTPVFIDTMEEAKEE